MKPIVLTFVFAALAVEAGAQERDCIENIRGETVCGEQAEAVRARIRAEAAYAQNPSKATRTRSTSPYTNFGPTAFIRGGYAFAGLNPGDNIPTDAPLIGAGARIPISRSGQNLLSFESEGVYIWGSDETFDPLSGVTTDERGWALTGLFGLRWQYLPSAGGISPFISAGVGPAYIRQSIRFDDGSPTLSADTLALGYSGRAGLSVTLAQNISIEWAYRYLGATRNGTIGAHIAEMGLNLDF